MPTNPPQAEDLRYWLRRFEKLRREERKRERQERGKFLEAMRDLEPRLNAEGWETRRG